MAWRGEILYVARMPKKWNSQNIANLVLRFETAALQCLNTRGPMQCLNMSKPLLSMERRVAPLIFPHVSESTCILR